MQLECSDEPFECLVGLQSMPSGVVRGTVEGGGILSAANGFVAVEDNGDTCVIATWAASACDVCAGLVSGLAHGGGGLQLRGQPLGFSDCARGLAFSRGFVNVVCGIDRSGRSGLRPNRRRAYRGAGIATT